MQPTRIVPLPVGLFTVPERERQAHSDPEVRRAYVVCAYLVRDGDSTVLFDTGLVGDQDAIDRYRPRRFDLIDQLNAHGVERHDVDAIVNCHLHADHAGGNHLFPGVPIYVQPPELAVAAEEDYTIREACVDFPDARFVPVPGRRRISTRLTLRPTPGHSPGHQSLVVEGTYEGTVLLAGQAFDAASDYAAAVLARQVGSDVADVAHPEWMHELWDIDVAYFAHDLAQWRASTATFCDSVPAQAWQGSATSP